MKQRHCRRKDNQGGRSMDSQVTAAWIAAIVAIVSLAVAAILQIVLRHLDSRAARKHEIIQRRRQYLFTALEVIDHVYSNIPLRGKLPTNPHKWDKIGP